MYGDYNNTELYDSTLHRVNETSLKNYDNSFMQQANKTGGRVDTSVQFKTSKELYGSKYYSNTINKIDKQGYITDIDPRTTIVDGRGVATKRFFRASDLYIVPTSDKGTGDKTFFSSIQNRAFTTYVRDSASKGGPIRLPNLPHSAGIARNFGSDSAAGYLQCYTSGTRIANNGLIPLASAPQNIQDSVSVEIANENVIGSSQGFNLYSNTGSRVITFSFDVFADYLPYPYENVRDYCLALKQMNYPTYSGMRVNSPDVLFVYGGIRIRGIPQITCTYDSTTKKGIVDKASVSVQITETEAIKDGIAKI